MDCRHQIVIAVVVSLVASYVTASEAQFGDFNNFGNSGTGYDQFIADGMNDDSLGLAEDTLIHNNKRMPSFSVNSGLRSLTDMLYSRERANLASGRSGIRNKLLKLGKRDWKDLGILSGATASDDNDSDLPPELSKRHSKQLSVSGPLSALANMLQAEGRRRQFTESRHNRMKLLELGKRSDDLSRLSASVGKYSDSSDNRIDLFE